MSIKHTTFNIEKPLELPDNNLLYLLGITADHLKYFFCLHFSVLKNNTIQPYAKKVILLPPALDEVKS